MFFYFALYAIVAVGIIFYSLTTISELEKQNKILESKLESERRQSNHWRGEYAELSGKVNDLQNKFTDMKKRYQECANKDV